MSLMGVDIGTSGCKVAAFSLDGRRLAEAHRSYETIHHRPGWAELDAQAVADRILGAVAEVSAAVGGGPASAGGAGRASVKGGAALSGPAPPGPATAGRVPSGRVPADPVRAISVSSMGEALVPIAKDGSVLSTSILSSDIRGAEYLSRLDSIDPAQLYRINPNISGINYSMPKICWYREHEPEAYRRTWKLLFWGDYLVYALTGVAVTSPSLANRSMLFDIRREDWSDELLNLAGISRAILPEIAPAGTVAGTVRPEVARALSLPQDAQVVVGGHDQALNATGAGAHGAGSTVCGIGTVECIAPVYQGLPDLDRIRSLSLNVEHHVLTDRYVSFLYNQAGVLINWFLRTFVERGEEEQADALYARLMAEMPAEPTELVTTPFFEPTGSPYFRTDVRGSIVGLRTSTTRGEILKSILEGETFYFVGPLDSLADLGYETTHFVATGGGAKSDAWLQIKADILGARFVRPVHVESGTLGAALLAGAGAGIVSSVEEAYEPFGGVDRTFVPDPERHARYREAIERYQQVVATTPRYEA